MFTLRNLLLRCHGRIDRILISYSKTDSASLLGEEYEKWYNESNKNFYINMDLQHSTQKLEEFLQLIPYLDFEVNCWDLFTKKDENVLEVSLE